MPTLRSQRSSLQVGVPVQWWWWSVRKFTSGDRRRRTRHEIRNLVRDAVPEDAEELHREVTDVKKRKSSSVVKTHARLCSKITIWDFVTIRKKKVIKKILARKCVYTWCIFVFFSSRIYVTRPTMNSTYTTVIHFVHANIKLYFFFSTKVLTDRRYRNNRIFIRRFVRLLALMYNYFFSWIKLRTPSY